MSVSYQLRRGASDLAHASGIQKDKEGEEKEVLAELTLELAEFSHASTLESGSDLSDWSDVESAAPAALAPNIVSSQKHVFEAGVEPGIRKLQNHLVASFPIRRVFS